MKNAIIIGGGLAGLTCSILLQSKGYQVTLIEKKKYPFHRVCGEYISNEVLPFLESLNIRVSELNPARLIHLSVTSVSGKIMETPLPLGGFGLSRYKFDFLLFEHAQKLGVQFIFEKVIDINFTENTFKISLSNNQILESAIAIAAYGKRSNLDQKLKRQFFYRRSPYLGVKYHIKTDLANNLIRLDNFTGGYCGVCKIEDDKYSLCYLSETANLKKYSGISEMEEQILFKNPHLKYLFNNSEFIFEKPEVINEISFERKTLVEDHLLFCGDAAGMITPLCGNGMAIAIHSGKILAESILSYTHKNSGLNRLLLEKEYIYRWEKEFSIRLKSGRLIQKLFGNKHVSNLSVSALKSFPSVTRFLVKKTHGKAFI
ncbi:NAD(P)/FAD-dependent oxidoreductase [Daejeonella oryzae]|uniref:NAD(P)/FAD-dependent oxidoreductase n=1 Tax=Daejeonella oryzae TaxID=1122943 RepID=UPI00040680B0|nr:NAD(P)/FAD-dependent oxidoreductase [Daejeonella oryzae]